MKISIITPSYNQGRFLEDAIRSVIGQDYPDFEHIIIDNCSTDDTIGIIKKYPHLKWISEPDKGQSDALNKGFKLASGEIIGWLNCDDFYLPNSFKKVNEILQHPKITGVYSDLKFCDVNKQIIQHYRSNRPSKFLSMFHTYISSEVFFFKRKIIDDDIRVETKLNYCMDQDFIAAILHKNYKLRYIKDCFAVFRWHGSNKSIHNDEVKEKRTIEGIEIFNKYNGWIKLNAQKPINQVLYYRMQSLIRLYRYFLKITSENYSIS
ncbi:MAG TPA: glycosyltransferase family 2 protein [Puia sp.]|jgi:glycosyltransferase involved in cell wall biosynthesis|nr:glycosyltransferase family 2 protein [Puia sp.]